MKLRAFLKLTLSLAATGLAGAQSTAGRVTVATLHPVLTDLAAYVGGDAVAVNGLMKPGADVHTFSPSPADMKALLASRIVFASGKKLENYLAKIQDNLKPQQTLVEVGRTLPSITVDPADSMYSCCPAHAANTLDPHWWNSLENMKRAADVVAKALAEADPERKAAYTKNAKAWQRELDELKSCAKTPFSQIPANRRVLATGHLSLGYFAREFGFKLLPVQGLNTQSKPIASDIATAIAKVRELGVPVVFPEMGSNLRHIEEIQRETGAKLGKPLIMDMNAPEPYAGFRAAFKHNVANLLAGLK
jgi:zinc/manganese transport system substrate-binding protein